MRFSVNSVLESNVIPGGKGLNPYELAHKWMKEPGPRPDMSIKVGW